MTTNEGALLEVSRIRASLDNLERYLTPSVEVRPTPAPVVSLLQNRAAFFDYVRARAPLGPSLSADEVAGCERILKACAGATFPVSWASYSLATSFHETAGTLHPIREYGKGHGRPYGVPGHNSGQVAYGRGDVQLTWDKNYERADAELNLAGRLIANYDLALDPDISARIMVRGLEAGWFTGKGLGAYLPAVATAEQFTQARRTVNGIDKAALIASYAITFQAGLQAGGWK